MTKIAIAGAGYVGLSLAALLAQHHEVVLVDVIPGKVDQINKGISPIKDSEIERFMSSGNLDLVATMDAETAYKTAEYVVIATPTNYDEAIDGFDTSSIEYVFKLISQVNPSATVVIKSTVPVGFTDLLATQYEDMCVLFSPEFLREGKALADNLHPSRIIVGVPKSEKNGLHESEQAVRFANLLQESSFEDIVPILIMGAREAESVKLFANTYLATRVAFFNELDMYAESNGLDTKSIIEGVTLDPRIGVRYRNPSFGYGGYCLPKDTKQLRANFGAVPQALIDAVIESNTSRKEFVAQNVVAKLANLGRPSGTVGAYRLIMKSESDNFRSAAMIDVVMLLKRAGIDVLIYEPQYTDAGGFFDGVPVTSDLKAFKERCDLIIANRMDLDLNDVVEKVYTRDFFREN